jgi:LPXTG-site transpeptidase (sortase) family protein
MQVWDRITGADWRRWLPTVLIVFGVLLLAVVGHEYWAMYREQAMLEKMWEEQNKVQASAPHEPRIINDGLTRVEIPKIDLDAIVVEGTTWKKLRVGPGRITSTAHPGEKGNAVITAHRDTFFRHIGDLKMNDEILIRRNGELLKFAVTGRKIVQPTDLSVLKPTKQPTLTLITCYPIYFIGPAPERLIVTAKLVDRGPNIAPAKTQEQAASSTP